MRHSEQPARHRSFLGAARPPRALTEVLWKLRVRLKAPSPAMICQPLGGSASILAMAATGADLARVIDHNMRVDTRPSDANKPDKDWENVQVVRLATGQRAVTERAVQIRCRLGAPLCGAVGSSKQGFALLELLCVFPRCAAG
eukprot:3331463-Alexandrium_andersonii.AAC.1